jgi:exodeoxyribonuclease VII large subunit
VLGELRAFTADLERRRQGVMSRLLEVRRERLALLARALPKPQDLLDAAQQRLDYAGHRLTGGLMANLNAHDNAFGRTAARFRPGLLERPQALKAEQLAQLAARLGRAAARKLASTEQHARLPALEARLGQALGRVALKKGERLPEFGTRMTQAMTRLTVKKGERLPEFERRLTEAMARTLALKGERVRALEQVRQSLNPDRPLDLGFARVNRKDGHLVTSPDGVADGEVLELTFKGDQKLNVTAGRPATPKPFTAPKPVKPEQGSLF